MALLMISKSELRFVVLSILQFLECFRILQSKAQLSD